jgi:NADH-quinone oxidoreductase subunit J
MTLVHGGNRLKKMGHLVSAAGLLILAIALPKLSKLEDFSQYSTQIAFWILSGVAVACSAAAITARNPVYTAIWFAGSLLGVAGLFLLQSAQFLGFATIVVYAGAIVVTFLFVLMLANPEGDANYDRVSWARLPALLMTLASAGLVAVLAATFFQQPPKPLGMARPLSAEQHMAFFGGELFARHLVAVEAVGTILLVALVGAIAIVIQGKSQSAEAGDVADNEPGGMHHE